MTDSKQLVIGVDLGTSGVRAIAFDDQLRVVAQSNRNYPVSFGEGGRAEQSALDVALASEDCIRDVSQHKDVAGRIKALSFCGTASSLALFEGKLPRSGSENGGDFEPASPVWLWADIRAAREAQFLSRQFGDELYRRTGCPTHASYWPAKLMWWRSHARPPFAAGYPNTHSARLAGRKDYLLYRLTGDWVTDQSTAAATGLYDSEKNEWDYELTDRLHVEPQWLPRVANSVESLSLKPTVAEHLQIPASTAVVVGSLDGVLVHLGMGCAKEGVASCTIGTSPAARMSSPHRLIDQESRTWCYPVFDDLWLAGGAGNNGGNVLSWLLGVCRDVTRLAHTGSDSNTDADIPEISTEQIIELAMTIEPGANGLLLLPYLFGERSPLWREDLKGAFVGLTATHSLSHIARAVLEGISLGVNGIYRALVDQLGSPSEVRAGGGFVASSEWVQLQADVFGVPVAVTATGQETATGAAMVGWHAIESVPWTDLQEKIAITDHFEPRPEIHERYQELFGRLGELRPCLLEQLQPTSESEAPEE